MRPNVIDPSGGFQGLRVPQHTPLLGGAPPVRHPSKEELMEEEERLQTQARLESRLISRLEGYKRKENELAALTRQAVRSSDVDVAVQYDEEMRAIVDQRRKVERQLSQAMATQELMKSWLGGNQESPSLFVENLHKAIASQGRMTGEIHGRFSGAVSAALGSILNSSEVEDGTSGKRNLLTSDPSEFRSPQVRGFAEGLQRLNRGEKTGTPAKPGRRDEYAISAEYAEAFPESRIEGDEFILVDAGGHEIRTDVKSAVAEGIVEIKKVGKLADTEVIDALATNLAGVLSQDRRGDMAPGIKAEVTKMLTALAASAETSDEEEQKGLLRSAGASMVSLRENFHVSDVELSALADTMIDAGMMTLQRDKAARSMLEAQNPDAKIEEVDEGLRADAERLAEMGSALKYEVPAIDEAFHVEWTSDADARAMETMIPNLVGKIAISGVKSKAVQDLLATIPESMKPLVKREIDTMLEHMYASASLTNPDIQKEDLERSFRDIGLDVRASEDQLADVDDLEALANTNKTRRREEGREAIVQHAVRARSALDQQIDEVMEEARNATIETSR